MSAKLRFYYGTMGSSKTLRLLTTAYDFEEKGIRFLVIKPSIDTRDGSNIIKSRIGLERECIPIDGDVDIYSFIIEYDKYLDSKIEWILVDECQFLEEEQVDQLARIADELNINVMCFGLRTDFMSHLFPASKRLFELADSFDEIKSRCECGTKTSINARFDSDGNLMTNGEQILLGGNGTYHPICRKCFFKKLREIKNKNVTK